MPNGTNKAVIPAGPSTRRMLVNAPYRICEKTLIDLTPEFSIHDLYK